MRKIGENPWRRVAPVRIRSIKELSPGFKPRWLKFEVRLGLAAFVFVIIAMLASSVGWKLFYGVAIWGVIGVMIALCILRVAPLILGFLGYYFPQIGVIAARLDRWLERDLERGS